LPDKPFGFAIQKPVPLPERVFCIPGSARDCLGGENWRGYLSVRVQISATPPKSSNPIGKAALFPSGL